MPPTDTTAPLSKPVEKPKTLAFGVEPSDRRYRLRLARYHALGEAVAAFARERRQSGATELRLVDVGLGRGRSRRYIEAHKGTDGIAYFGLDLNATRLSEVYRRESWNLVESNLEDGLPFPPASFDIVICEQVLEHVSDPAGTLRGLARILRQGGLLVAGVPIFPPGLYALRKHLVPWLDRLRRFDRCHLHVFSLRSFAELVGRGDLFKIEQARGFRIVSGGVLAPFEDFRWWWRLNRTLGASFPSICVEAQIVARRSNNRV